MALNYPHLGGDLGDVRAVETVGHLHLAAVGVTDDDLIPLRFEEVPIRIGSIIVGTGGNRGASQPLTGALTRQDHNNQMSALSAASST